MERLELKIGFLNHFNKWWVGGITYFKNLFQAMSTTESPHLVPVIFPSPDELAQCLLPYVATFSDPPPETDPEHLPTAADYHVDMLSHLNGNQVSEGHDGIAWIADFQHVRLPEMFNEQEIAFRNRSFHSLIEQNRIVCLSSYDAMEDFRKYAPEAAHKARCLHFVSIPDPAIYQLSETEATEIRRNRQLPERYFYVPNQFWKHKNHIAVLKAVSELKKSGLAIHVVFSGNTYDARFPHYFEELEAYCKQEQIEENVHFLGLIPLKEVYFLMRDCLAMINPSQFEGWSSSVEEAKSIGKTIFLSNLNVHYEQMPPQGIYFPVDDPEWLADLLRRAWSELKPGPDLAMEMRARNALPRRIRQFGKDFQKIVLDALENRPAVDAQAAQIEVTVITAVGNLLQEHSQEKLIRTLESVAAQKGVVVEHLIVDGDSTARTREFLQPYLEKFNCKLISGAAHGMYGAMNAGTISAQGKYVNYLNPGDCYENSDFLKRSVAALDSGNLDFSYGEPVMRQPDGARNAGKLVKPDETRCFVEEPFALSSMLFVKKTLFSVAVFNDTLHCAGAYDLILRLILAGKRGIRIEGAGVCCVLDRTPDEFPREVGIIYARHYGKLGYVLTPEEGAQFWQKKELPEDLQKLLAPYCACTFAASRPELSSELPQAKAETMGSARPLVSVILPLVPGVRFLKERIESIRNQNLEDYEVIALDAGLSEAGKVLVNMWAENDSRVRLYRQAEDLWNFGISKAQGRYFYFALNDQSMTPDCLGRMAEALTEYPECLLCDTRVQLIDQQGNGLSEEVVSDRYFGHLSYPAERKHVRMAPYDFLQAVCGKKIYVTPGQIMVRRELLELTGPFPETAGNSADYLWSLQAALYANVIYLPEQLVLMRLDWNPDHQSDGFCWDFGEIAQYAQLILTAMPDDPLKTVASGLATLLDFKRILLPLKSPLGWSKKLACLAKAAKAYPKKSLELIWYILKFHCRSGCEGSSSIRANNALIAARMKKYQWMIRYGHVNLTSGNSGQSGSKR